DVERRNKRGMQTQTRPVEIHLPESSLRLYGNVTSLDKQKITVRLDAPPPTPDVLRPEMGVGVMISTSQALYQATGQVIRALNTDLELLLTKTQCRTVRREQRLAISIPVSYRAVYDRESPGTWNAGTITNISLGGLGLSLTPSLDIPPVMEF